MLPEFVLVAANPYRSIPETSTVNQDFMPQISQKKQGGLPSYGSYGTLINGYKWP